MPHHYANAIAAVKSAAAAPLSTSSGDSGKVPPAPVAEPRTSWVRAANRSRSSYFRYQEAARPVMLSPEQQRQFFEVGFVALPGVFSRA